MYCTSNGQIPGQIPESNRSGSVTECKNARNEEGGCIWFIDLNSLVRGGNSSKIKKNKQQQDFLILFKPIRPKILHCAIECVTLCWSASEGLSPQLGKEASLLPSNTIHTLLTLPPTRPQSSSALPSWHSLSSYHIAPWVTMSGVTINACLLLALTNTTDWVSPLFASSGGWGSETPWCTTIRKRPHLQRES